MKMLAEERNTGTLELILTKSISDRQLVAGKFLGSVGPCSDCTNRYTAVCDNIGQQSETLIMGALFVVI